MKLSGRYIALLLSAAGLMSVALPSCRSSRTVGTSHSISADGLRNASDARVELRSILATYGRWDKMRVPVTIRLSQPKSISISGTAFFDRGKSLFISLKYFGFEIANIYATDDSVMVVDKVNKQYAAENIRKFLGDIPVTLANLQDLLTGRVFTPGKADCDIRDFSTADIYVNTSDTWSMIPGDAPAGIDYGFSFNPAEDLKGVIFKSGSHQPVTISYAIPVTTPYGPMAPNLHIEYATAKTAIDASIEWGLEKARWNGDVELREPSISSRYRRISTDEITRMLSKL